MTADRRATLDEVSAKRSELRSLASRYGFTQARIAAGGMIVVHSDAPGYRAVARFAGDASRLVGAYVQVITDDVPACLGRDHRSVRPAELLTGLARELDAIAELVARGREAWETDELIRLSVERRWIIAGNYAESYRLAAGVAVTTDPWSELYDYRCLLAHALPELLEPERIWQ
jgi:hypothetical protein